VLAYTRWRQISGLCADNEREDTIRSLWAMMLSQPLTPRERLSEYD